LAERIEHERRDDVVVCRQRSQQILRALASAGEIADDEDQMIMPSELQSAFQSVIELVARRLRRDAVWSATAGAEAAAKVGEVGAAGGADAGDLPGDKGYSIHFITDAGVSATVTVGIIRVKPVTLKN
jgi:hypothetical protein